MSQREEEEKEGDPGELEGQLLPAFEAGGIVSHVNDSLQVPIMLPITCRPVAARYLVIALAQIALGRLADRSCHSCPTIAHS